MSLLHRFCQQRWACPLVLACVAGNLLLMVFYIAAPSNQPRSNKWQLENNDGPPLFMHEPLSKQHELEKVSRKKYRRNFRPHNDLHALNHHQVLTIDLQNPHDKDKGQPKPKGRPRPNLEYRTDNVNIEYFSQSESVKSIVERNKERAIPLKLLRAGTPKVSLKASGSDDHREAKYVHTEFNPGHGNALHMPAITTQSTILNLDREIGIRQNLPFADIDPEKVRFVINPKGICANADDIFLVIAICSGVQRFELRKAIRDTWATAIESHSLATRLVFVLGTPVEQMLGAETAVQSESEQYGDILIVDLKDESTTLTFKTLSMFHWVVKNCGNAQFLMKADDDVFVNVPNVLRDLNAISNRGLKNIMLGHVIEGAKPIKDRKDKWFMPPGLYKDRTFPSYLSGSAYVMPISLLEPVLQHSQETSIFWLEDIYITGILAPKVNATLIHNSKFEYRKRKLGPCRFKMVNTAHDLSPADLYHVWREMHKSGLRCSNSDLHFLPDYNLYT